jgi:hypothetical protein
VYQHSKGLPRLINTICENALIVAYALQVRTVTAEIVDNVAREFRLDRGLNNPDALAKADGSRSKAGGEYPHGSLFQSAQAIHE